MQVKDISDKSILDFLLKNTIRFDDLASMEESSSSGFSVMVLQSDDPDKPDLALLKLQDLVRFYVDAYYRE